MRFLIAAALISTMAFGADANAVKIFTDRVNEYARVRKAATDKAPPLPKTATPQQIENHEKALVEAIRAARANAKQGDVFTPEVRPMFAAILRNNLTGPQNKESREVAKQGNPKHDAQPNEAQPVIQVNAAYPKSAPLSSVPPALLLQLPKLPASIEYRFVGKTLVLFDNISNLIIDYMKEAAPGL